MKGKIALFTLFAGFLLTGCTGDNNQKNVISTRYIHKYGYDVPKDEWLSQQYPGQVLTTLQDGKTIVESYEDGLLHGPRTETYPHSQTIQTLEQFERGKLTKRVTYTIRGVPEKEEAFKTESHIIVTSWYQTGTPKSKEEFKDSVLVNGQYFNYANETDSRIDNGNGEKTIRNASGDILSKEVYNNYVVSYIETYYPNNSPFTATSYENGVLHGEKKVFAMTSEPLSVENYLHGEKHGLCTYYQNGSKYLEIPYERGFKEGVERQYIDGEIIVKETEFHEGAKHGPSVIYCDGSARTKWYFENQKVSRSKFDELSQRHNLIMSMQQQ